MLKLQKIPENPKMNFNGQPNMFFDKNLSCTCDLHLKQKFLNPFEHNFLSNGFKNESFVLQPFPSKFQDFEIFV